MTALRDAYVAAYSTTRVLQVSNPDEPGTASNSETKIESACVAAIKDFQNIIRITFDGTDTSHLAIGIEGVDLYLQQRLDGSDRSRAALADWRARLESERLALAAPHIAPQTDGNYTPTEAETGRPPLDAGNFNALRMSPPRSRSLNSDRGW